MTYQCQGDIRRPIYEAVNMYQLKFKLIQHQANPVIEPISIF